MYAGINIPWTATSIYISSLKQYLLSWIKSLYGLTYKFVVRPLLRPDIRAAVEVEPALKLQQTNAKMI